MPFFNSMVRKLLRHCAHPWCTRVHWAGVAICFLLTAGLRWVAGVRALAATSGSQPLLTCDDVMQGFQLPARKGIADFLQEVTSLKDQQQYWAHKAQPYEFVPVEAFARAFRETEVGRRNARRLEQPYERPPGQLFDPLVRKKCASWWPSCFPANHRVSSSR